MFVSVVQDYTCLFTTAEIIKQIINTEVNKSSVSAIVNDVTKRQMEKQI